MRNSLNVIKLVVLTGLVGLFAQACSSKANNKTEAKEEACCSSEKKEIVADTPCCTKSQEEVQVTAYYFHATRRCATCQAVEKVSKEYIENNYKGTVNFISINREEEQNKDLVEKYEIAGQTLLIVFGDEVVNLTTDAFMNARSNPEKLEEIIKSTIDSHLI